VRLIQLPNDFTWRPPTLDDIPAVAKLINDYSEHYIGYRGVTENDIETEWTMPKFKPDAETRLVYNSNQNVHKILFVSYNARINDQIHNRKIFETIQLPWEAGV